MICFRFAPSPTGLLHIGNARIAVLNYLLAKKSGAKFVLRFDDTDRERSTDTYVEAIKQDLDWLGLRFDRQYRQSERHYDLKPLKNAGLLYPCYETLEELEVQRRLQQASGLPPRYQPISTADRSRAPHWRFRLDIGKKECWYDCIVGQQSHSTDEFSDPVVVREDGVVLYTLASVMDDVADSISWIVRGKDHVSNTVVQRQIFRALGKNPDEIKWSHVPLLVEPDGKPLSKRRGATAIAHVRHQGVHPWSLVCAIVSTGKKTALKYAHTFEELVQCNEFEYGDSVAAWDDRQCIVWERRRKNSLTSAQGVEYLASHGWSQATCQQWLCLKDELHTRKEVVYWREVCTNPEMWFAPLSTTDHAVRQAALACNTCDVTSLTAQTACSAQEVGQALRYALTGHTVGPKVRELLECIPQAIVLSRLECLGSAWPS